MKTMSSPCWLLVYTKEEHVLFNDALDTFLDAVMVKDHIARGVPLLPLNELLLFD